MVTSTLQTLRWSAWLGWRIESNWTDPALFFLYLVLKPVCGSMILALMFFAAREAAGPSLRTPTAFLPYVYVSNACYGLIGTVMFGMSYVVIFDREHYRMLKYVFISPAHFQAYFLGRAMAKSLEGFVGAVVVLGVGMAIPAIRKVLTLSEIDIPLLLATLGIGTMMLCACGMILASAMLNMSRGGMFLSEGIAGVVYFLSGVVFPLSLLPNWLQAIGMTLPTTYWLEAMRRALTGRAIPGSPHAASPLASWSDGAILGVLFLATLVLGVFAQLFYRWSVARARRLGKIDETSSM